MAASWPLKAESAFLCMTVANMPSIQLEYVVCPLCGSSEARPLLSGPDRVHGVPGRFHVVECIQCGLAYQNPRPTAQSFAAIYPPEYEPYHEQVIDAGHLHPDLAMTCAFVRRSQPTGGKLLDIGCGPGRFLQALQLTQPHWQLLGVEPDPQAAHMAQQQGLQIINSTIEQARVEQGVWDAITLWNVIEHLSDPVAMLQEARRLLRPGGMLYMAVPLRDSWDARLFGRYWTGWELPRHFTLFDKATLIQLLDKAGFKIRKSACINGRSYGFSASLRLLLQEQTGDFTLRRLGEALTYSRPLALALSPYTALAVAMRRCTVLSIAADME